VQDPRVRASITDLGCRDTDHREGSKFLHRALYQALNVPLDGYVPHDAERSSASAGDLRDDRVNGRLLEGNVVDSDRKAFARQLERDPAADALRRAGYDCAAFFGGVGGHDKTSVEESRSADIALAFVRDQRTPERTG
jgi:hypothetical protein